MENVELERESDTHGRPKSMEYSKGRFARALFIGSMVAGTLSAACSAKTTAESEDDIALRDPGVTEPYGEELSEQPLAESKFVFPEYGPTLDSQGFPEEGYIEPQVGVGEIRTPDMQLEYSAEVEVDLEEREDIESDTEKKEETIQEIAYNAVVAAANEWEGQPYSWNAEHHHCSGYVALYFEHLGFNIGPELTPVSQYNPQITDPMPNATTVKQVPYLRMLSEHYGEDLVAEIEVETMLTDEEIWEEISPGTVLYLPERIGHHGYDTFTHVGIFMGLNENEEPMFSEFSSYMRNGPEYGYGFNQFTRMYRGQNIEPYNPNNGPLMVFMFNAVEASRRIKEENNPNIQGRGALDRLERITSSIYVNNLPR